MYQTSYGPLCGCEHFGVHSVGARSSANRVHTKKQQSKWKENAVPQAQRAQKMVAAMQVVNQNRHFTQEQHVDEDPAIRT